MTTPASPDIANPIAPPSSVEPAVALHGVAVDYGDGDVLADCNLAVAPGEWVALVGPNGAGKSTALGVMTGLVTHTGSVALQGRDPSHWKPRRWARTLALVPQRPIIPGGQTVTDYVLLGRTSHIPTFGVEDAHDLQVVDDTLQRLDLRAFAERQVLTLSGGELQRVVLARALAQQAPIMLLDEPTSALDIGHGQHVLELVDQLRTEQGLTIIAAMHDLTLAGQFADRIVMLANGHVVADDRPERVLTQQLLQRHYDADVTILHDDGGIVVAPARRSRTSPPTTTTATTATNFDAPPRDPATPDTTPATSTPRQEPT